VRVNQVKQQVAKKVTVKGVTTTILTDATGSPLPSPGKSALNKTNLGSATKPPINKELASKSWVSQVKPSAHNYHLRNLQAMSEAATEEMWTPKYVKKQEAARLAQQQQELSQTGVGGAGAGHLHANTSSFDASMSFTGNTSAMGAGANQPDARFFAQSALLQQQHLNNREPLSKEQQVELAFKKFKNRLKFATLKWEEHRNGGHRAGSVHVRAAVCV
jgi:hypothetical protein